MSIAFFFFFPKATFCWQELKNISIWPVLFKAAGASERWGRGVFEGEGEEEGQSKQALRG